jgi:hypothetical protein
MKKQVRITLIEDGSEIDVGTWDVYELIFTEIPDVETREGFEVLRPSDKRELQIMATQRSDAFEEYKRG